MFVGSFKVITSFPWVLDVGFCIILRYEDQVVLVTNVAALVS